MAGKLTIILLLKCDGTRAESRFCLSAKRRSPFKSAGASVQSTTGSRGVRISGSNAGYTIFQKWCEGYWLPTPFGSFPFHSPPVRHRGPSHFNWSLPLVELMHKRNVKKVKCTVVQALRLCTGHTVHRRSRGIGKCKVHRCTGTEALYRPYGP